MDDLFGMSGGEAGGNVDEGRDQAIDRYRPARELCAERLSVHQLGRDVEFAVDLLEREDGGDGLVRKRRRRPCFLRQPFAVATIARVLGRKRLERNGAAKPLVAGRVHDAHAAAAHLFEDRVRADLLTNRAGPSSATRSAATDHAGTSRKLES